MHLGMITDCRTQQGRNGRPSDMQESLELVALADRIGYHSVWTTEQHVADDGYLPAQIPFLAAAGQLTENVRLCTGVLLLPLRHPRHIAEEVAVLDVLSHGRATLGVGAGGYPEEFRLFGVPRGRRGRDMESGLRYLRSILHDDGIALDGVSLSVPPVQAQLPVVVGAHASRAVARAVQLADGYFAARYLDVEKEMKHRWQTVVEPALVTGERSQENFRLPLTTIVWPSESPDQEWREYVGPGFLYQQQKYLNWFGSERVEMSAVGGAIQQGTPATLRSRVIVGRPNEVSERLSSLREDYPFDEIVFWPRLPGVPLELAKEGMHMMAEVVAPQVE